MHRIITAFSVFVFALTLGFTTIAGAADSSMAATAPTSCPSGETYVKPYTKSNGTKVAGYCKTSKSKSKSSSSMSPSAAMASPPAKPAAMSTAASMKSASMSAAAPKPSCPPGKSYVNGYTKQNGTKVKGYCRSTPTK